MMPEDEHQYNDSNRAFLQAFMAKGALTLKEAKPILARIFSAHGKCTLDLLNPTRANFLLFVEGTETVENDVTEEDLLSYIAAANDAISFFDLEIRSMLSQTDHTRIWALVNTTSDPMTQLATTHSADEISFLKRLLDAMFETYNTPRQEVMAITAMQAVRLHKNPSESQANNTQNGAMTQGSSGKGLTMADAERTLESFVEEGWFEKSHSGFFTLSPRALMELKHYLVTTYNGPSDEEDGEDEERIERIKNCYACRELITVVTPLLPSHE
jgi:non-structural maintenance of chromosomes element 1